MKKMTTLLAAVMLLASITACGEKNQDDSSKQGAAPTAAVSAAATATPGAAATGKLADVKKAGKLVIGTSADYAPYEFHKNIDGKDTIVGFDIEIAKTIANDMGVKLEIKDMGFDGLLAALDAGKVDFVISGMTPNAEREKIVDFSKVYYNAEQIILVRAEDKDKFKSMDDIKKATVGVQTASIQEDLAKKQAEGATIKSIGKITDLVMQLKGKKVDALFMESPVATGYVKKNTDLVISNVKPQADKAGSAIAVKKGNKEFVDQINKTLDRLMGDKTLDKLVTEASALSAE
ncbi:transporter substrate-binding domain-containing protein [Gorillibacterium sp. sgz5001074]|uniref:transporter substrate-binding domain-containing protein n=1 Tax=Gorillibacterium sp. sgz5001074 TaxID=3446695 RepID=UPI003F6610BD